jgi:hypothetical protein
MDDVRLDWSFDGRYESLNRLASPETSGVWEARAKRTRPCLMSPYPTKCQAQETVKLAP